MTAPEWLTGDDYILHTRAALAASPLVQEIVAEAVNEALDDVTTLHRVIADVRMATVGSKPMLSELAAALVAWRAEAVKWQPIETAPRGELLLGFGDGATRLISWESGSWVQVGATIEAGWFLPTHWMPLPAPPADIRARGEG